MLKSKKVIITIDKYMVKLQWRDPSSPSVEDLFNKELLNYISEGWVPDYSSIHEIGIDPGSDRFIRYEVTLSLNTTPKPIYWTKARSSIKYLIKRKARKHAISNSFT